MAIFDIIKYEGDNRTFVWKFPGEDFNTLSTLIVHETQEAVLFKDGQVLDVFSAGRYTLHTKNIPLLNKIINLPMGGVSPFHCEVYFVNKTEQMAIPWGMGAVNYLDPTVNDAVFEIGASGELSIQIKDSGKLLLRLVGTEDILNRENLMAYFKSAIIMHVKNLLPKVLQESGRSIFEVENDLPGIAEILKKAIQNEMEDYGIAIIKFWVSNIKKPEDDPAYIALKRQRVEFITNDNQGKLDMQKAEYEARKSAILYSGEIEKQRMDMELQKLKQKELHYSYQQERAFEVMEHLAKNEGTGADVRNAMMGVGVGFGVGGTFGQLMNTMADSTMGNGLMAPVENTEVSKEATSDEIPGMIHIKNNEVEETEKNEEKDSSEEEFEEKVRKLAIMHDSGILSDVEFQEMKQRLLDKIL